MNSQLVLNSESFRSEFEFAMLVNSYFSRPLLVFCLFVVQVSYSSGKLVYNLFDLYNRQHGQMSSLKASLKGRF